MTVMSNKLPRKILSKPYKKHPKTIQKTPQNHTKNTEKSYYLLVSELQQSTACSCSKRWRIWRQERSGWGVYTRRRIDHGSDAQKTPIRGIHLKYPETPSTEFTLLGRYLANTQLIMWCSLCCIRQTTRKKVCSGEFYPGVLCSRQTNVSVSN